MTIHKPTIILVRPQLSENIGMSARAMDNFGLKKLILVNPRNGWPNKLAIKSSAHSKHILLKVKIYKKLNLALENFNFVVATSNRKRFLQKPHENNMKRLFNKFPKKNKTAIIFGPENSGLSNSDLILSDVIFNINTSGANNSLNLSHAVLLMSYNWNNFFISDNKSFGNDKILNNKALNKDLIYFMDFLKKELEDVGFLYPKNKSKKMFSNIQSMLVRSSLSKIEIKTLWGMVKKLRK